MADPSIGDTNVERRIPISGIPPLSSDYTSVTTTVATSSILTITITTYTAVKQLGLMNPAFTIHVDTDSSDYRWPTGDSLSAAQASLRVFSMQDWETSDDKTNKKVYKIIIENYSGGTRTIYLYYKYYTFAYLTGDSSGA